MARRWIAAVAIALIASLGATGCGTFSKLGGLFNLNHNNDYAEAFMNYDAEAAPYSALRHKIVDSTETRIIGAVTDSQFKEFQAYEDSVISANKLVFDDLGKWQTTGSKPADFAAHRDTLRAAQKKLMDFVRLVTTRADYQPGRQPPWMIARLLGMADFPLRFYRVEFIDGKGL